MATPTVSFVAEGKSIDYTPGSAVAAGDVVVQNELIGVAKVDIAASALGALAVAGLFDFPKTGGSAGETHAVGVNLYWNASSEVATTTAGANKLIGKCAKAASATDTTVRILMNQ